MTQQFQIIEQPYDEREEGLLRSIREIQERHQLELTPWFKALAASRATKPARYLAAALPIYTASELQESLKRE